MTAQRYKRYTALMFVLLMGMLMLIGCGENNNNDANQQQEQPDTEETEITEDTQLYIVLYTNTETQRVFLQCVESGRQEEYEYNGGTYIRNSYEKSMTITQLQIGELVHISYTDKNMLTEINISQDTFVYDKVSNFGINTEADMLTIADTKYYYDESLKIFSEGGIISINELSKNDTICIRGKEKQILTIVVTKGHGSVFLKNTELFEGGMITIGNVVAQKIVPDMVIEIPEGTYKLAVANDGYGGEMELTVARFEEITLDLNTLKGEGPQYCQMQITATPEDAQITLDGALVDTTQLLEVKYGTYRLKAQAEGYVSWSGNLVVSSKEAALSIDLEPEETEDTEDTDTDSTDTDSTTTDSTDTSTTDSTDTTDTSTDTEDTSN